MTEDNIKGIIAGYNDFIKDQQGKFIGHNVQCPYYFINLQSIKKLPAEQLDNLRQSKAIKASDCWKLWKEIFSKGDYRAEIQDGRKLKPKKIWGVNFDVNINSFKLIDEDWLYSYAKSKGLFLSPSYIEWLKNERLIEPLRIKNGVKFFSRYQLLTLDRISWYRQTYPEDYQFQTLYDKKGIIGEQRKNQNLFYFLELMSSLDNLLVARALADFKKLKKKFPQEKNYNLNDIYQGLQIAVYEYYSEKFKKLLPINNAKSWAYNVLPAWVIRHNPILQLSDRDPILIKLLKTEEKRTDTIFRKGNEIKLANFYIHIIEQLIFYINITTNGKDRSGLVELLTSPTLNKQQICKNCQKIFTPNPSRKGGRRQVLCGDDYCKSKWRVERQKEYRRSKK